MASCDLKFNIIVNKIDMKVRNKHFETDVKRVMSNILTQYQEITIENRDKIVNELYNVFIKNK